MPKCLLFLFFITKLVSLNAQDTMRVDPPFWWNNLKELNLQLAIYYKNIGAKNVKAKITNPNIKLVSQENTYSNDFLILNINLGNTKDSILKIEFINTTIPSIKYNLYALSKQEITPVDEKDIVYLVFPDRFCNADSTNDVVRGLYDQKVNRSELDSRHGGDIKGIESKLNYFKNLGITTLWVNPTLINNQPNTSYHGYALTDHYRTDPRFGNNNDYKNLSTQLHQNGMKLIMDLVPNHVGSKYWMLEKNIDSNIIHNWGEYIQTNYKASVEFDPYASAYDKTRMKKGWFDKAMPDVNDQNKWYAKYLMQSYMWWINYAGIDGFRIDTYSYNDLKFMNNVLAYIKKEHPNFYSTGEIWEKPSVYHIANFTENNLLKENELTSAIDFQLYYSLLDGLTEKTGWDKGIMRVYNTLAQDKLYKTPTKNLTFIENHDLDRIYGLLNNDIKKLKLAYSLLFTLRGIPCIYQGGEILVNNIAPRKNDGEIRTDILGGWSTDSINKFDYTQLTNDEKEIFDYLKKIIAIKKNNPALQAGSTTHYIPSDGEQYAFVRTAGKNKVLVIANVSNIEKEPLINLKTELKNTTLTNLFTNYKTTINNIKIPAESCMMFSLD